MTYLMPVSEAMRRLGIKKTSLYGLIAQRELDAVLIGRRRLIVVASVERYVERLQAKALCPGNSMADSISEQAHG